MDAFKIENGILEKYTGKDAEVVIPDGVTKINESAFEQNKKLKKVVIPASVTYIGEWAFHECKKLKEIVFEPGSRLEELAGYVFWDCHSLVNVTLPAGIARMGEWVFYGDKLLETVTFSQKLAAPLMRGPNDGITFPDGAHPFTECRVLNKIYLPARLKADVEKVIPLLPTEKHSLERDVIVDNDL